MTNTQKVSTQKIVGFVVFICAALMASLFIYHSSQKSVPSPLPPEIGMIFPVARDIKSFELIDAKNKKFTERNFFNHWTLLFFGFTHCSSVCPVTLDVLNRAYTPLQNKYPDLNVVLVSVDPDRDTPESLNQYAQKYNSAFIGVTGKIQEIRKLQSQLGIYSGRDNSSSGENYQIQHTASILLINPQGKWVGLFKFGVKPEDLVKGIEAGIKAHGLQS